MTDSMPTQPGTPIDKSFFTDIENLIGNIAATIDVLLKTLGDANVISADTVTVVTTIIDDLVEAIKKIINTLLVK
ncbi:hypothetical protein PSI15_06495 [Xenorhabdus sp. PR6a]|uniref:hypothetical protein n=1 Tax=Xenorhabdus sp. PR6a TaxID=3025877 RepID=UPI0023599D18|nr:hypothetical protein [Xenorhabdus sp. PR6a]MDC9581218.1 hypothetical protein [Xenorhabdus sp. PR6a]